MVLRPDWRAMEVRASAAANGVVAGAAEAQRSNCVLSGRLGPTHRS